MSNNTKMYWIQTITPLHVGAGKEVGFVDMPIMREKVTNWPLVPGSAVKGVMRDHFGENEKYKKDINAVFGKPDDENGDSFAGALVLTDAHIVCMPLRSLYGTFAYVTCPLVLARLKRDLEASGYEGLPEVPKVPVLNEQSGSEFALCTTNSSIVSNGKIFLEDLDFVNNTADNWADKISEIIFPDDDNWKEIFRSHFVILSDDSFTFLSETGTEVAAHITIDDETKTAKGKALWYEEALPAEAILAGAAWCDRVFENKNLTKEEIFRDFCTETLDLQIGGKATVGKGRVKCSFTQG
ncbi:type III-B CRISPR module RAMP protein Cmr4 [Methanolacinia paynteri]|uniref:type III-B CRISPR module RAMP protein Cmr4 n=1 Tax=Methanolacinia paynteri TaxID=230356 RepID=UPI0006945896|nr:type III-B CRISPR module RAMP protein Cmr4 [Methanolacinia paynteri]